MAIALFDTNILIDLSNGIPEALTEIKHFDDLAISAITYMEYMAGVKLKVAEQAISPSGVLQAQTMLSAFTVIHTNDAIMHEATRLRVNSLIAKPKISLPDTIIHASAIVTGRWMVTRNRKDFVGLNVRIPYELSPVTKQVINVAAPPP